MNAQTYIDHAHQCFRGLVSVTEEDIEKLEETQVERERGMV